jgi:hypothetical protein
VNNLYAKNGLIFWDAEEIKVRDMLTEQFSLAVQQNLSSQNAAFKFIRIEAPLLTPCDLIDAQYTADDIYKVADDLALRPETTMGSYQAARWLLTNAGHRLRHERHGTGVDQQAEGFRAWQQH